MASLLTGTTIAANIALHAGNYNSYALPLSGGTLNGVLTLVSSGTAINISGQSDSFGYNATAGQGTYIKGTGTTYIYGGGVFFDGTAIRTLLHSNNYTSYPDATKLPLAGGTMTGTITGASDSTISFNGGTCSAASYNYILSGGNDGGNKLVVFC